MNVTLGSLRERDLLALEDLDLLPEVVDLEQPSGNEMAVSAPAQVGEPSSAEQSVMPSASEGGMTHSSRSGTSGGIRWFEDMIQGSQLGHHSKRRKGYGTSVDGTTTVSWEVSEYYEGGEEEGQTLSSAKRKAGQIEGDDTTMQG